MFVSMMHDKVVNRVQIAEGCGGCGAVLCAVLAAVGVRLCVGASSVTVVSNGEHLVVDGDFNVRGTLRSDAIDDLLRRLEALEGRVAELEESVGEKEEAISELQDAVREKEERIVELEGRVEHVENITSHLWGDGDVAPLAVMDGPFRAQNIPTRGAIDWEYFSVDGDHFLAVANLYSAGSNNVDSVIYIRDADGKFVEFQRIGTTGAADWEYFNADGDHFLVVANRQDSSTRNIDSVVYVRGPDGYFVEFQRIGTSGAQDWEYFEVDGEQC